MAQNVNLFRYFFRAILRTTEDKVVLSNSSFSSDETWISLTGLRDVPASPPAAYPPFRKARFSAALARFRLRNTRLSNCDRINSVFIELRPPGKSKSGPKK